MMRAVLKKTLEPTHARRFARASSASGEVYCVHPLKVSLDDLLGATGGLGVKDLGTTFSVACRRL